MLLSSSDFNIAEVNTCHKLNSNIMELFHGYYAQQKQANSQVEFLMYNVEPEDFVARVNQ